MALKTYWPFDKFTMNASPEFAEKAVTERMTVSPAEMVISEKKEAPSGNHSYQAFWRTISEKQCRLEILFRPPVYSGSPLEFILKKTPAWRIAFVQSGASEVWRASRPTQAAALEPALPSGMGMVIVPEMVVKFAYSQKMRSWMIVNWNDTNKRVHPYSTSPSGAVGCHIIGITQLDIAAEF